MPHTHTLSFLQPHFIKGLLLFMYLNLQHVYVINSEDDKYQFVNNILMCNKKDTCFYFTCHGNQWPFAFFTFIIIFSLLVLH